VCTFYGLPTTIVWEAELQVPSMPNYEKEIMANCESLVIGKRIIIFFPIYKILRNLWCQ
jgi:hypothetical protein